jgi:nucleotide-binding universal stress UspA family protein
MASPPPVVARSVGGQRFNGEVTSHIGPGPRRARTAMIVPGLALDVLNHETTRQGAGHEAVDEGDHNRRSIGRWHAPTSKTRPCCWQPALTCSKHRSVAPTRSDGMFDRILLALEDSPAGEMATDFAVALARRTGASVHVLHVNERLVGGHGVTLRTRIEATDLVTDAVHQFGAAGVHADGSVRVSSYRHVPDCIVTTAYERAAGAILLGSNRKRRLGRLFSARVRERTTRLSSLPVLTAPAPLTVTRLDKSQAWLTDLDRALDSILD